MAVTVGQVECDLDPLPALNRNCLILGLEFFRHQSIEQSRVLELTVAIALEEVMQHRSYPCQAGTQTRGTGRTGAERRAACFPQGNRLRPESRTPHDAGNGRGLRQPLLLHQQGQC